MFGTKKREEIEVIDISPKILNDSKKIVKLLSEDKVIRMNLSYANKELKIRVVDFITGALMITGGDYKNMGENVFLLMPTQEIKEKLLKKMPKK